MDQLTKAFIGVAKSQLRHFSIIGEPWSIWAGKKKIIKDLTSTIYKIAHVEQVKQYWVSKDQVTVEKIENISWQAIGQAMTQSTWSK
jgi:hypothetical protein